MNPAAPSGDASPAETGGSARAAGSGPLPPGLLVPLQPSGCRALAASPADPDTPCCGEKPSPPGNPMEQPGYRLLPFVQGFGFTDAGPAPLVATRLSFRDRLRCLWARLGPGRKAFTLAPGLYGVGDPGRESPVLVTANYGLTFHALRRELAGLNAWILVLDTRGVNVWCAAGKGVFSAQEVAARVRASGLERVVSHGELILPQLAAPGISAREVKGLCGFIVRWGPIRARDIRAYLAAGKVASPTMRQATFPLAERAKLLPVELYHLRFKTLYALAAIFLLSGLGVGVFSLRAAWTRGVAAAAAFLAGVLAGTVAAPLLLPWLPGRALAVKGAITGLAAGGLAAAAFASRLTWPGMAALLLLAAAASSFLAMNFTGSTPYTSPSGVEKEMRRALPAQILGALAAAVLWVIAPLLHA